MISPPRRLLIIKPSSFGDIVHALPVLGALRRSWAETSIDWLVKKEWMGLLQGHPMIGSLVPFPENFNAWRLLRRRFARERYDMTIDLQGLLRSGIASLMTRSPIRIGFSSGREGSPWFYTRRIQPSTIATHAVDRNLDLVRQLGVATEGPVEFPLPVAGDSSAWVNQIWSREGLASTGTVCLVHPAARWETKRWPGERYAELADRLITRKEIRVVFISGKSQTQQVQQIVQMMRAQAINLAGQTTLAQLTALLRKASLLVSNDSGPIHLAAAVGTPVVGIYGPTDPRKVGPYDQAHSVIHKGDDCRGCGRGRCRHGLRCLREIAVDEVVGLIDRRLMESTPGSLPGRESFEMSRRGDV